MGPAFSSSLFGSVQRRPAAHVRLRVAGPGLRRAAAGGVARGVCGGARAVQARARSGAGGEAPGRRAGASILD